MLMEKLTVGGVQVADAGFVGKTYDGEYTEH